MSDHMFYIYISLSWGGLRLILLLFFLFFSVGFHRYILENFTGDTLDGVVEREVEGFDPPVEVSVLKNSHLTEYFFYIGGLILPS